VFLEGDLTCEPLLSHILKRVTLCRVFTCAYVCAVCSFALGDEGGGVQLAYAGDRELLTARGLFLTERELGCCLYFLYF